MSFKNIRRNEFRARKKSGRARTNAVSSMTPQGQALWASRNIDNAFGFIGPEYKPPEMYNHLYTMEEWKNLVNIIVNQG